MKHAAAAALCMMCIFISSQSWGHAYIKNKGVHTSTETAIPIKDITVSRVVYHQATAEMSSVWLKVDAKAGQVAKIQIGVPYIPGLENYRPAFAVLGPGMPSIEAPFDLPAGYGGVIYTTDAIETPEVFDEEFTGTTSWIFPMQEIPLPADGSYYIVGYVPSQEPGKFWVAPGTREYFTVGDILSLPWVIYKVRTFHEVFPVGGILSWGMLILTIIGVGVLL